MDYRITLGSSLTIYRQIVNQVLDGLAGGKLKPGDSLPSQDAVSRQLGISPLTVKKAYEELEKQNITETRRGIGTFIRADAAPVSTRQRVEEMRASAWNLVVQARVVGVPLQEVIEMIREADRELRAERQRNLPVKEKNL